MVLGEGLSHPGSTQPATNKKGNLDHSSRGTGAMKECCGVARHACYILEK
jgi:hypothetical protein